jgi:S1-C subfamily serine protease
LVTAVDPGGPAASAGLRTNDVITKIDGETAIKTDQLVGVLLTKRPGDSVTLDYTRQGRSGTAHVTLGRQP